MSCVRAHGFCPSYELLGGRCFSLSLLCCSGGVFGSKAVVSCRKYSILREDSRFQLHISFFATKCR